MEGDCVLTLDPPSARQDGAVPYLTPSEAVGHPECSTMWGIRTKSGQQMSYQQLGQAFLQAGQQWCKMDALFCLKTTNNYDELVQVGRAQGGAAQGADGERLTVITGCTFLAFLTLPIKVPCSSLMLPSKPSRKPQSSPLIGHLLNILVPASRRSLCECDRGCDVFVLI